MSTPDDRRIAFANELIRVRKKAGLNGKQLAERCGWQASKVSKIENKRQDPTDSDVLDWMTAVEAPESEVERMREWLRSIDIDRASWKHQLHRATLTDRTTVDRSRAASRSSVCSS
ncbi:helix-turn-helix domain-containing protein [Lentzea rhizosphaerae]|uniref:Helix-turn-helix domain-containing protein n=1 Tax=Lentzea rhizosphaerae TaxID=2041025 RepID=A0ABV8CAL0_9PSEU